jgi:hypothetical protein
LFSNLQASFDFFQWHIVFLSFAQAFLALLAWGWAHAVPMDRSAFFLINRALFTIGKLLFIISLSMP